MSFPDYSKFPQNSHNTLFLNYNVTNIAVPSGKASNLTKVKLDVFQKL